MLSWSRLATLRVFALAVSLFVARSTSAAVPARYTMTEIGAPGIGVIPRGIDGAGEVVGTLLANGNRIIHAFRRTATGLIDLGTAGTDQSEGWGTNDVGDTAAQVDTLQSNFYIPEAVIFRRDGTVTRLGTLGGDSSQAFAVNDLGCAVGSSKFDRFGIYQNTHAFRSCNGVMVDLGTLGTAPLPTTSGAADVNDAGDVVGWSGVAPNGPTHAFRWHTGVITDLGTLGGTTSFASAINDVGQVAGYATAASDTRWHAVLWQNGQIQDLGTLNGKDAQALDVNNQGDAVGWASNTAVLFSGGRVIDLKTLVDLPSGVFLLHAVGINDRGEIAVDANTHGTSGGILLRPVWCGNGTLEEGETCDDGNAVGGDCCSATCTLEATGSPCAGDGNPCTNDQCDGAGTCTHPNNTAPCEDGLFCNGPDTCNAGACSVHAGNPCAGGPECADACNEATDNCFDLAHTPCTNDGNPCTDDQCDGAGACTHPNNTAPCEDGLFCNGPDICNAGACTSHAGNPCAGGPECANACNETAHDCLDLAGTACTNDGEPCTLDECDGTGRCAHPAGHTGTICRRGSGDACDADEVCDGSNPTCPPDTISGASVICRPAAGICDVAESCTGIAGRPCPPDLVEPDTTVCRPSAGDCDVADTCDGSSVACPADAKSRALCRAAAGDCDVPESCDGIADTCPADAFAPASTVCRPATEPCDVAETCTGNGPTCPADTGLPDTDGDTVCDQVDNCVTIANAAQDDNDGDRLGDACDPCTNIVPTVASKQKLTLTKLQPPATDDTLSFRSFFTAMPSFPAFDPLANGVRFLIVDSTGAVPVDITISGGAYAGADQAGWMVNGSGSGTSFTYLNRGTVVPLVNGITKVQIKGIPSTPGKYRVAVKGKNGNYVVNPANLPLTPTIVFDVPYASGGQCGEATFPATAPAKPSCRVSGGSTIRCK